MLDCQQAGVVLVQENHTVEDLIWRRRRLLQDNASLLIDSPPSG